MARLTEKQKRFVEEYLNDLNATQAAIRAGYSPNTANRIGSENLTKPDVKNAIQKAIAARQERTKITQDRVLQELAGIAFANGADFVKVVGHGAAQMVEIMPTDELDSDKRAAISGIEETKYGIKVSTCDKVRALELLGKHLGMFDGKPKGTSEETNLLDVIASASKQEIDTDDLSEIE